MSQRSDHITSSGQNVSADGNLGENGVEKNGDEPASLNEKASEYIKELLSEKIKLNSEKFPVTAKLIDQEIQRVQANGRVPVRDSKYQDVFHEKPVKLIVKVLVPVKEYPKFNFVGKLLGPKGNTMKQLQETTLCKMAVLGRGSMRDRQKEESLRNSRDPKFAHLLEDLHVEISALAPPAEAHARIAFALSEVKKYIIPDNSDMMMPNLMDRMGPPMPLLARPMPRMPPPPPRPPRPPMMRPGPSNKVMSLLERTRASMMETAFYDEQYGGMSEQPQLREPPPPPQRADNDFYYERDSYYDDEQYYKDDVPPAREFQQQSARDFQQASAREYQQASVREVGTRRPQAGGGGGGQAPQRFARTATFTRRAPYARPAKYQLQGRMKLKKEVKTEVTRKEEYQNKGRMKLKKEVKAEVTEDKEYQLGGIVKMEKEIKTEVIKREE